MSTQPVAAPRPAGEDFMPLHGIDHVELWVGNAAQAAYFYREALGFEQVAYAGLETGVRDRVSYVLQQGRIRLVLTGALDAAATRSATHHARHGDGVKVIALSVPDAGYAYRTAVERGARGRARAVRGDATSTAPSRWRRSPTYGDTLHTFVERAGYDGRVPARLRRAAASRRAAATPACSRSTTSSATSSSAQMETWVKFYEDVFGMTEMIHFSDEDISTEYSALMSKVVTSGNGRIKFPINEPAEGKRKSQIDEYLEFYGGAGAQHIAVATRDIVGTVDDAARARRRVPDDAARPTTTTCPSAIGEIEEDLEDLRRLGILVDRDDEGYLLQIFTKPIGDRPTMFFEVIERHGARGFGEGNFKALFEAIEREQERRGNL